MLTRTWKWKVSLPKTNTENAVVLISEESGVCAKVIPSQLQEVNTANIISYLSIDSLEMGNKIASLYNRMLTLKVRPKCLNNVVNAVRIVS